MNDKDEPGVYGFQMRLPRTFSSISNPKVRRRKSELDEKYYKQRSEIEKKITQVQGGERATKSTQKSRKLKKTISTPANLRGTNLSSASQESSNSMFGTDSESEAESVVSDNSKSLGGSSRGATRKEKSRRPSLKNRVGLTNFEFNDDDFDYAGSHSNISRVTSNSTMDKALDFEKELDGEGGVELINESLVQFKVVPQASAASLGNSYRNLMSGMITMDDDDEDDSQNNSSAEFKEMHKHPVKKGHLREQAKGFRPKVNQIDKSERASEVKTEPLGVGSIKKQAPLPPKGDPRKLGRQRSDLEYTQDLDPEIMRSSLKRVEGAETAQDYGNRKLQIRPKGKKQTGKRRSTLGLGGPGGKCVIS